MFCVYVHVPLLCRYFNFLCIKKLIVFTKHLWSRKLISSCPYQFIYFSNDLIIYTLALFRMINSLNMFYEDNDNPLVHSFINHGIPNI